VAYFIVSLMVISCKISVTSFHEEAFVSFFWSCVIALCGVRYSSSSQIINLVFSAGNASNAMAGKGYAALCARERDWYSTLSLNLESKSH